jgi:hypothetical protein
MRVVFTAQSKQFFYCRDAVCAAVLEVDCLPLNPFRVFNYFLDDRVDRDKVRQGNNTLIRLADEVWIFGIIADGVLFEIEYALELKKPIRFFTISSRPEEIREIGPEEVKFEPEIHASRATREQLLRRIAGALPISGQLSLFRPHSGSLRGGCYEEHPELGAEDHTNSLNAHSSNGLVSIEVATAGARAHCDEETDGK